MNIEGFSQADFQVFQIDGLDARMAAIQEQIQPKFRAIGEQLRSDLSMILGNELYLHIAKHARRTVNPPKDTWLAICDNKRGYKKHPHFQLGLFDDRLFIWFALIYELPNKAAIASSFLDQFDTLFATLPADFVLSQDHMKKDADPLRSLSEEELIAKLERFRTVKKAELLIGRHLDPSNPLIHDGQALTDYTLETFKELLPFYKQALKVAHAL